MIINCLSVYEVSTRNNIRTMPSKYSNILLHPVPISLNSREAGKFSFRHTQTNLRSVKQSCVKAQNVAHVACYVTQ